MGGPEGRSSGGAKTARSSPKDAGHGAEGVTKRLFLQRCEGLLAAGEDAQWRRPGAPVRKPPWEPPITDARSGSAMPGGGGGDEDGEARWGRDWR
jgi:hypothetical protein